MSKEVGTPRYLSLVVPLKKVGDEAVHKELGDRIERAATTASSLEAEQDSEKPIESDGFAEIIDFLKASSVHYALTVNPIIYTSCIEQFWATAKVQTVNGVRQLQALFDKKRVIVTESSIRRDLHLDDAEGTDCLPTATIFEELARMGYEKPSQKLTFYKAFFSPQWKYFIHTITQCLSAKSTAWNVFSCSMASLIICLATNQKFNMSKYIFDAMVKHLDGGVKFLMYPRFLQVFINQQLGDMSTHKKIFVNPFHTKKVFANMKRAYHPTDSTQVYILDQPSTSSKPKKKQPSKKTQRHEAEVSQDETEHEESVPIPSNDPQTSGKDSMQLTDLMVLCTKLQTQVLDLEKAKDAQVMAALVIFIFSDVSVESVGSSFPRVILIGSISVEVPVEPDVGAAAVSSPAGVLDLDTHSSSEADPSESSITSRAEVASRLSSPYYSIPEIPTCSYLPTPSYEFPICPLLPTGYFVQRQAILIRPGEDIPIGRLYHTHYGGPCRALTARKSVRPLPSHRLALRYTSHHLDHFTSRSSSSHSSSDHSSFGHSI
ncbi:hypothetical protein Tco_0839946 [Tanacetum coccineum]|uniref:Uncharacterized protein n=1 Tax=Tanacetum coccineum TaxID=301880 RepID=A0ABQ5AX02_9ASTR